LASARMIEAKTHRGVASRPGGIARASSSEREVFAILHPRKGGLAEGIANSLRVLHPAIVFIVVMLASLAAVALLSIGLGLFTTRVLEHTSGIGAADEHFNTWLAAHRTSSRTEASLVGSIVAGGVVLPIVVGSIALVAALLRKWRIAAFAVFALGVESASYRATTLVVHSHRPRVARLEHLPVNASYPSGHTAAALAVYGGLVLLLTSRFTNGVFRGTAWTMAAAVVAFVALSRMYRGMHHPLDVGGGVVVGIAALIAVVFACRTAGAAADARNEKQARAGAKP
jgi:membrane-associated phospholipid phosphatase